MSKLRNPDFATLDMQLGCPLPAAVTMLYEEPGLLLGQSAHACWPVSAEGGLSQRYPAIDEGGIDRRRRGFNRVDERRRKRACCTLVFPPRTHERGSDHSISYGSALLPQIVLSVDAKVDAPQTTINPIPIDPHLAACRVNAKHKSRVPGLWNFVRANPRLE